MDKPRQSDSFAGHVEGQIAGISFGSVGAPHDRKGRKQQQDSRLTLLLHIRINIRINRLIAVVYIFSVI